MHRAYDLDLALLHTRKEARHPRLATSEALATLPDFFFTLCGSGRL